MTMRIEKSVFRLVILLSVLVFWVTGGWAEDDSAHPLLLPEKFEIEYVIKLGGVTSGVAKLVGMQMGEHYDFKANVRSTGVIDRVIRFRSASHTRAKLVDGEIQPTQHTANNLWKGEKRTVRQSYLIDGAIDFHAMPSAEADSREPVAPDQMTGSVDLISALVGLTLSANSSDACRSSHLVFDGRRLYRLSMAPDAKNKTDVPNDNPTADNNRRVTCFISYERLGGRSANPWWPRRNTPRRATVAFEPKGTHGIMVATRLKTYAGLVPLVISMERITTLVEE